MRKIVACRARGRLEHRSSLRGCDRLIETAAIDDSNTPFDRGRAGVRSGSQGDKVGGSGRRLVNTNFTDDGRPRSNRALNIVVNLAETRYGGGT